MSDHVRRLAEIDALLAGIPGGVWSWEEGRGNQWTLYVNRGEPIDPDWPPGICNRQHGLNILLGDEDTFDGNGEELRAFILAAPTMLRALLAEHRAAADALAAAGIPDDGRPLAERVKALCTPSYALPITEIAERHQRAEQATAGAGMGHTSSHSDRGVLLAEVARQRRVIDQLVDESRGVERGPAPDVGDVSLAHLRALEIVAYSDGSAVQIALAGELVGMGAAAVAEAVCRAYEEGRAAEARQVKAERDRFRAAIVGANNALAEVCHGDHEHQIECHSDTLPAEHRRVAAAAEQASGILAEVVLDLVEQGSPAGAIDTDEAAEAMARCARGEHRSAGETMPGSCADCGVDWGDLGTEDDTQARDVAILAAIDSVAAYYPADLFPPDGTSIDAKNGTWARRVVGLVREEVRKVLGEKEPMLSAALPHLGIEAVTGATPQALAENVADQIRYVLQEFALAEEDTLEPRAQELGRRLLAWLNGDDQDDALRVFHEMAPLRARANEAVMGTPWPATVAPAVQQSLTRLAADPLHRAAFNAFPGEPPRIMVLPVEDRGTATRAFREEHGISAADLATALRVSEVDVVAIEGGSRTTDAAGWREIMTQLFLLGATPQDRRAEEAGYLADPMSRPGVERLFDGDGEDEPAAGDDQSTPISSR